MNRVPIASFDLKMRFQTLVWQQLATAYGLHASERNTHSKTY